MSAPTTVMSENDLMPVYRDLHQHAELSFQVVAINRSVHR